MTSRPRALYLTATPTPYRVAFFDLLAARVDLTVYYEGGFNPNRDRSYYVEDGYAHEAFFSQVAKGGLARAREVLSLIRHGEYDLVVVGCYNSQTSIFVLTALKSMRQPYAVNVDGYYFPGKTVKRRFRDWLLHGADGYLIAGRNTGKALQHVAGNAPIFPYGFSPLYEHELAERCLSQVPTARESFVLCVGQYAAYKGLDVLLDAASRTSARRLVFVGSAGNTQKLKQDAEERGLSNVEVIPYLAPSDLSKLYRRCALFVLPSRQECWGLVVNEAASFATPIVSTWGAGGGIEFVSEAHPEFLANPGDADSLASCIERFFALSPENAAAYGRELQSKNLAYSIERSVDDHVAAFESLIAGREL